MEENSNLRKENPMTVENDALHEELLALMKSPQLGVPEYSADPIALRRLGAVLSEISARARPNLLRDAH
jgi:hypothetical protein